LFHILSGWLRCLLFGWHGSARLSLPDRWSVRPVRIDRLFGGFRNVSLPLTCGPGAGSAFRLTFMSALFPL
jgi:hypothetical protein